MQEEITKFIKNNFFKITNKKLSNNEIERFILPVFNNIFNNKSKMILISGSQGIGKTSYMNLIEQVGLKFFNKRILNLSLDHFYLDKKERKRLSLDVHPLLITRGVPGTHDIKLLQSIINQFKKSKYPLELPIFNKLEDKRKKITKKITKKCDILILEGWCVSCTPISNNYLYKNINLIEKKFDKNKKWRNYYNKQLKTKYFKLFNLFNYNIFFKTSSFSNVLKWRIRQEKLLKKINRNRISSGMSNNEIMNFIQYYEKITRWMLNTMPSLANIVLYVNKNQKITKIKKN